MLDLRLDGGTLVIPGTGLVQGSIGIKDGTIALVGSAELLPEAVTVVNCQGKHVFPGIIDPHVHLGIYTDFAKECYSETRSALAGGITTIGCFVRNTGSYLDSLPEMVSLIQKNSYTDIFLSAVLETPEHLEQINSYASELGVTSFKLYMTGQPGLIPDVDDGFILAALKKVARMNYPAIACVHAENTSIVSAAVKEAMQNGDPSDLATWEVAHPAIAEDEAVQRFAYLAEQTGSRAYIVHISAAQSIQSLARKKGQYNKIFGEVNSSHLSLTSACEAGLLGKMAPPLRRQEDVEALWQSVRDDVADTFATDNVSLTREIKQPEKGLFQTRGGKPALATHLPVLLHEGYHKRAIPLLTIAEKASQRPAQIFGIYPQKGAIAPGSDADLVVVDLDKRITVDHKHLHSFGNFSLYDGKELQGWPVMTIKGGEIAVENNVIRGESGKGRYLRRRLQTGS